MKNIGTFNQNIYFKMTRHDKTMHNFYKTKYVVLKCRIIVYDILLVLISIDDIYR